MASRNIDPETHFRPPQWHFARPGPIQRQRNSKLDEHFAGSGSDRSGDLTREGVQNADDAGRDGATGPVRIRIGFGALSSFRAMVYGAGLMDHLPAIAKQKRMDAVKSVSASEDCKYLTFEDFNTTGLTGDPQTERRYDGDPPNAFHTFFRAEGQTDKIDDRKQGSKGVGKVTFIAASRARAVLGLTCRYDDARTLLFGTAVLHTHRLNGQDYDGDAWFGREESEHVQPLEDIKTIEQFRNDFQLARSEEPGFSIVVPWLDMNDEDGVTPERVVHVVLRDHALPILQGKLVIEVIDLNGTTITIDSSHFLSVLDAQPDTLRAQVRPMAELAAWALAHPPITPTDSLGMHKETAPAWSDPDLISAEQRDRLVAALDAGDPVALRVPIRIRAKGVAATELQSYFDVFLRRDLTAVTGHTVQYVRNGLLISGMSRRVVGVRALVVAEDGGLAGLLRASENPSHTKWNAKPIKDRFTYATGTLAFVVESIKGVAGMLASDPTEKDASIWANELGLPAGDESAIGQPGAGGRKRKRAGKVPTVIPPPPPKKRPYDIAVIPGGFAARPSGRPFAGGLPAQLELQLAYHVRGKNPLAHYENDDFDLTDIVSFPFEERGCMVTERHENRLVIRIDTLEFEFKTTGFDTRRELFCKPRLINSTEPVEDTDDDAEEREQGPAVATAALEGGSL